MRKPILLLSFPGTDRGGHLPSASFPTTPPPYRFLGGTELRIPVTVMGLPTVLNSSAGLSALWL
ncbi:hypothetical protein [Candidatus Pollutiaquabacter sp.]|uniref:hypothetical protein n=1 Tax=Candidatus Pollutiaquabacter sp. TaxID=3416354 RepID=UPI003CB8B915|nr:hypothetical protein [Bacteroidota bacterium]